MTEAVSENTGAVLLKLCSPMKKVSLHTEVSFMLSGYAAMQMRETNLEAAERITRGPLRDILISVL